MTLNLKTVVIGPMDPSRQPGPESVPLSEHLPNIVEALHSASKKLQKSGRNICFTTMSAEDNKAGDINQSVFPMIDACELAIVDISTKSPNVLYEASLLHSLGRPTIVIDYETNLSGPHRIHYLSDRRIRSVKDFTVHHLENDFFEVFSEYDTVMKLLSLRQSPILNYYKVPLVDYAAADGNAIGYYRNFVRRIISKDGGIIDTIQKNSPIGFSGIRKFAVIVPNTIQSMEQDIRLTKRLRGYDHNMVFQPPDGGRQFTLDLFGPYIVDYPRALQVITELGPYRRLALLENVSPKTGESQVRAMEAHYLSRFFSTLKTAAKDDPEVDEGLLECLSPGELITRSELT
ncbi:MAG: STING domain-containing protein [Pseudomonadota bacterium]